MKIYLQLLTVLCLLVVETTFSQAICGFDKIHHSLLKKDSVYRKMVLANDLTIKEFIRKHPVAPRGTLRESSIDAAPYTIPVVVHVVHTGGPIGSTYNPTDAQITGAINYLNQVYNGTYAGTEGVGDLGVQFVLASRDQNCNPSSGIDRIDGSSLTNYVSNGVNSATSGGVTDLTLKNFDRWDPTYFYNIWVVNKIDAKDGTSGQFIAGYAYYAGASAQVDGTVMLATQMIAGQKTLPHEIGHALSLYHPFEGSTDAATCPANANCTTDGDQVCDTDPVSENVTAGVFNFSCRTGTNTCTGTAYSINTEHNFMNYTNCYTLFTAGQKARIQAAMSLPSRASLATSSATGPYPVSPYTIPVAACSSTTGATGLANNYAGIMNVSATNKSFPTSTAKVDGGYVDKTTNCLNVLSLQRNGTYTFSATVLTQNAEQLRVWIDYNNDGSFSNATEQIYYNANIPIQVGGTTVSWSFTVPATAITNTVLRMRVIDELTTAYGGAAAISSACYNSNYGQAEDYAVVLSSTLPVTFEYLKASRQGDNALLSWKTSFEQNAKEFAVEKSTDGVSFTNIGTVPAANISNGATYSFTDKNISAPTNFYRIREIDIDLKSELSQAVLVRYSDDNSTGLRVINNPFTDQLNIEFTGTTQSSHTISLFDITGRKIFGKNYQTVNGQIINIDLTGLGLKQGTYILQTQSGDRIITKKLIKQ